MKKVLIVSTVSRQFTLFERGNIKVLKQLGYEVHAAANFSDSPQGINELGIIKHDFNIQRSPFSLKNINAYKELKKIMDSEKFDLIHCHSPMGGVLARLAARKKRKNGTRVIYTAHGFHFFKGAPLKNWVIFYPIEKFLSRHTDCLITINEEDYNIAKRKFNAKQTELVHGVGIDETKFKFEMSEEEKNQLRKSLGLGKDDFVIIQVGELNKNKNQIMTIKAMNDLAKENNNIKLLLVGEGTLKNYYKETIEKYGIKDNVKLLGYRKDIPKLLKISDVLASTSIREGLPVNVMEAMACGLPIVATDCRGNRDLIRSNSNGFIVQQNDINKMVEIIEKIYIDMDLRGEFQKKKQEEINNYKIEKIMLKMKEIYTKKKKIIHFLASNSFSGAENVACTIINNFENEYDMYYCSLKGPIEKKLKEENIKFLEMKKISVLEIKKIIRKVKPDVIHAHDFRTSIMTAYSGFKGKIISHLHNNPIWIKRINLKTILYLVSSLKYNRVLMVSKAIKKEYIFSKFLKNKIEVIGNPIDNRSIRSKVKKDKKHKKIYDVIFLGRLTEQKDPIRFIEIIKRINEKIGCRVVMAGDGNLRKKCETLIRDNELKKNIEMKGFVEDPFSLLYSSKILCMTSKWEGFGLVAIEALSFGVPVVVTNVGGLPTIVNDKCGKVCCNDEVFVEEIENLLKNEKYLNTKSRNAYIRAEQLDNINMYIERLSKIYKE